MTSSLEFFADIIVYGGTSAAITAAVQAVDMGRSVIVVSPDRHLGGLSAGGLGYTDAGNTGAVGGLAREFHARLYKHYSQNAAWRWQPRDTFRNEAQGTPAMDHADGTMWSFEPHAAEKVFEDFVAERKVAVHRDVWLDRAPGSVTKKGTRVTSFRTLDGRTYKGRVFVDATYEGDLMAAAGVSTHVGREANAVYGETWNGVQANVFQHGHSFPKGVDPYVVPGVRSSGLLPLISPEPIAPQGTGDKKLQAYCFRMCLTNHPDNRVPFAKPEGYDPATYELALRVFATGWRETFNKFDDIPNCKTDTNNHGPFSTDFIGMNHDYPEASYERRREIIAAHERYQKGLLYFLANDPRVPDEVRMRMATWGLPKDEFVDNGHWSHQIYVREARRLVGEYVMTEHDVLARCEAPKSIGMGSYHLDSHHVQRYVTPEGHVQNEGDIGVKAPKPYRISYGSLTPKRAKADNLLVPVCVSSTHIAFGSIRMEPVFMILGQSAGAAAALAVASDIAVQDVDYEALRTRLVADGQRL
jgi:hypothetical protein